MFLGHPIYGNWKADFWSVSYTIVTMESGAGVMLLVLSVILCGGGRPIGYEPMSYDVVDVDPPSSEFNDFDDEDGFGDWVKPLHVTRDIVGIRSCAGFLCTWELHKKTTTPAPQFFGPLEHANIGKKIFHLYPFKNIFYNRGQSSSPGSPK